MSQIEKLLARAKSSPQNISFSELQTLAAAFGLPLMQAKRGGSHYVQRLPTRTNTVVREGHRVKKWYVKDVVEAITEFGNRPGEEDGR